jgi:alginate O-acetyltransferase complex protein AlgI
VTLTQFATPDLHAAFIASLIACTPCVKNGLIRLHHRAVNANVAARAVLETAQLAGLAAIFILCTFQLAAGTYNPFIYFRF